MFMDHGTAAWELLMLVQILWSVIYCVRSMQIVINYYVIINFMFIISWDHFIFSDHFLSGICL